MAEARRILHVAAEVQPLLKTGGLADVVGALPGALHALGDDVRVLMPGYGRALERARAGNGLRPLAEWDDARVLESHLPEGTPVWLYETQAFHHRGASPYATPDGVPWPDNAERFAEFARVAAALADDALGLGWRADIVHAHDWHTGLVPVYLQLARVPAASVFTVHNLAYQGLFPLATRAALGLPGWLDHWSALEFREHCSFIKGGIAFADRVTTVSRTYAGEITTPAFGEGLEGLLAWRGRDLAGIANGIDTDYWNPASDPAMAKPFDADDPTGKGACRAALLRETGLEADPAMPIVAYIGRLTEQKGADLLIDALARIIAQPAAMIVLGSGDPLLQAAITRAARSRPDRVHAHIGFDEGFAHRLYAGADLLVMPSRFEPCGLSQLNAMRYGTLPIVHRTGGLAETIVDTTPETLADATATGFAFDTADAAALIDAVQRATRAFADAPLWRRLVEQAMRIDSSWTRSAEAYSALYSEATKDRRRVLSL